MSGGHRDLVDLVGWVPAALVDALDRLGTGALGEAEDVTRRGVGPRLLEVHALVTLVVQVRLVCFGELPGVTPAMLV